VGCSNNADLLFDRVEAIVDCDDQKVLGREPDGYRCHDAQEHRKPTPNLEHPRQIFLSPSPGGCAALWTEYGAATCFQVLTRKGSVR
jgi:hypothetical protein